ncbi:hypothetical protein [Streptomyces sp. NBC_00470]|uniref:hypothetical protein n=1 Tax=Streptomyces sp. NBC_00470 TaxID=2975753 RepID=UPI0030DEADC1
MGELIAADKAVLLGSFPDSPAHYLGRWWRQEGSEWLALTEESSAEVDTVAERYRAASTAAAHSGERLEERARGADPRSAWAGTS